MKVYVLLDHTEEGSEILLITTSLQSAEKKKFEIELSNSKADMELEDWESQFLACKEAAGFEDVELFESSDYDEWYNQYMENFPFPDVNKTFIWGDLIIKEYELHTDN